MNLLTAKKVLIEYVKDLLYESTSRIFLVPAVSSVIFIVQRPNIALFINSTRILSDLVKC